MSPTYVARTRLPATKWPLNPCSDGVWMLGVSFVQEWSTVMSADAPPDLMERVQDGDTDALKELMDVQSAQHFGGEGGRACSHERTGRQAGRGWSGGEGSSEPVIPGCQPGNRPDRACALCVSWLCVCAGVKMSSLGSKSSTVIPELKGLLTSDPKLLPLFGDNPHVLQTLGL